MDAERTRDDTARARHNILARLRQAAAPAVAAPPIDAALLDRLAPLAGRSLAQCFAERLRSAHAEVFFCSRGEWPARFARLAAERSWRNVLATGELQAALGERARAFAQPIEACKRELFDVVEVGVTRADCAIADTGLLVLKSAPDSPRTLSLVPPVNVCVVDADRLYPSLLDALHGEGWQQAMPANLIFVSGPSKTADIQQTLAYGAHGPKELLVLVECDTPPAGES